MGGRDHLRQEVARRNLAKKLNSSRINDSSKARSVLVNTYLLAYNFGCALGWMMILVRMTMVVGRMLDYETLHYNGLGELLRNLWANNQQWIDHWAESYTSNEKLVRWVQTWAFLEIGHSLFGVVKSPVLTTLMQVSSRLLLVWPICFFFPEGVANFPAYTTMVFAWSLTEVIRYSYLIVNLSGLKTWRPFSVLRYSTFLVLYPIGISSEVMCIYKTIPNATKASEFWEFALWTILAIYIPGSYVMYTHMLRQRKRVLSRNR